MNITLIGMAGAGKSYIGQRLAERLGLTLLDIDRDVWEVKYGKPIQAILDEKGEDAYVREEERLIIENTKGKKNLLISPPGSVAYQPEALRHLNAISKIIYLKVPFARIEERVSSAPPRALIGLGKKTLRQVYDERVPLYKANSHFTVDTEHADADEVIAAVLKFLGVDRVAASVTV